MLSYECRWCGQKISRNSPKQFRTRVRGHVLTHAKINSERVEIEMDRVKQIIERGNSQNKEEK